MNTMTFVHHITFLSPTRELVHAMWSSDPHSASIVTMLLDLLPPPSGCENSSPHSMSAHYSTQQLFTNQHHSSLGLSCVLNSKGVVLIAATPNAEQGPSNPSTYTG